MDSQRLILLAVFSFSLFMLFQAWEKDHAPKPVAAIAGRQGVPVTVPAPSVSTPAGAAAATPPAASGSPAAAAATGASATAAAAPVKTERVTVTTDFVVAEIDGTGGTITHLELRKHHYTHDPRNLINKVSEFFGSDAGKNQTVSDPDKAFVLLEETSERKYIAQSGFSNAGLPNDGTAFSIAPGPRELKDGQDTLEVRLQAPAVNGVKVDKVFVFHRASYMIDVRFEIANQGSAPLQPLAYFQFIRDGKAVDQQRFVSTFTGPAFYTDASKFHKVVFSDIDKGDAKIPAKADNGWVAMVQHYFVSAWLPAPAKDGHTQYEFYATKIADNLYSAGVLVPVAAIAPGATGNLDVPLYSGPEDQDRLTEIAPGLDRVVDYGFLLTIIAEPLFWVLEWLHKWVQNWGVAIILLTCMIKAIFFPLSAASYKSMARMRLVSPRLAKLKEQYGDDRLKMNQAMMELYKTEKINPLGGCLPIVVQIPVFISLYWVLLASVELRNAPFFGWIHDLSSPDPYCVLPIIMTASSYIQVKLNPPPPDPVQAKVMLIMPLAFGVMFFFFPAGLVLYWVVNNILSIAQQWQITRMIESGKDPDKSAGKGGGKPGNKDRPKR